jgi:uncharacterized protein YaeQ
MAEQSTLYRFDIELSDIDRSVYESLALRVACHPSEDPPRLVARVLAYCLLYETDLEFGKGLSSTDEPALWRRGPAGEVIHWVDIGYPSADRMHRASKKAQKLSVVCHKGTEALAKEASKRRIHEADSVEVIALPPGLVSEIADVAARTQAWTVVKTGEDLQVVANDVSATGDVRTTTLSKLDV